MMLKHKSGLIVGEWREEWVRGVDLYGQPFEVPVSKDLASDDAYFWLHGETWYRSHFLSTSRALVYRTLELALMHISEDDERYLQQQASERLPELITHQTKEGYLILLVDADLPASMPIHLLNILCYSLQEDCLWVFIHGKGPVNEDLPCYRNLDSPQSLGSGSVIQVQNT